MHYKVENSTYSLSYQELKQQYSAYCDMSDGDFLDNLTHAAHLACFISWFKELPNDMTIGDTGIVHQLIHLLDGSISRSQLSNIRSIFKEYLKLA